MAVREMSNRFLRIIVGIVASIFVSGAPAQQIETPPPLFSESEPLDIRLEAPLRTLRRDSSSRPEHDGLVSFTATDGRLIALDVEVRIRGNSRLAECDFPPLRLDFRRSQLSETVFAGQNRLKLVTLCKERDSYRDYLHLEYDIYRLLNALTEVSFRVRMVNVQYVATDSRRKETFAAPAFLIEDESEVANRQGLEVIEQSVLEFTQLDPHHTALLSVFHYMIGNTDWSVLRSAGDEDCCHNGKVIGSQATPLFVLPYDFDQAGLIDTDYASPSERLPIRSVRQRLYRGICAGNDALDDAIALILDRRTALERVLASSQARKSARSRALAYLQKSLELIEDPESRAKELFESCRG